jgi:hypothetical protein
VVIGVVLVALPVYITFVHQPARRILIHADAAAAGAHLVEKRAV